MNKPILHLLEDEKFVDVIVDQFESVAPDQSVYLIVLADINIEVKYIKTRHPNMVFDVIDGCKTQEYLNHLDQFKVVMLHNFFHTYKHDLVRRYQSKVHFHWMCWGGDLYNSLDFKLYGPQTKQLVRNQKNFNGKLGVILQSIFPVLWYRFYLKPRRLPSMHHDTKLFRHIRSCSTVIPKEYDIIKKTLNPFIQYMPLKYGDLTSFVGNDNAICNDVNFLIGNSASQTSNHLEAFDFIKSYCSDTQKVVMPLSYGDMDYAEHIINKASELFGDKAMPLTTFLNIQDYNKILLSCGNVVMNHYRQQAMGNIIIALYRGARVFFSSRNPVLDYLNDLDMWCFELADLSNQNDLPSFSELAAHNRPILERVYGRKQVLSETKAFVDKIMLM